MVVIQKENFFTQPAVVKSYPILSYRRSHSHGIRRIGLTFTTRTNSSSRTLTTRAVPVAALDRHGGGGEAAKKKVPNSNYVVPLDDSYSCSSSCITRPLAEILRDLNKRIPDNIIISNNKTTETDNKDHSKTYIPWYHANRMLSFYAPGWCGEIRDVIFSDNGSVTVVYRVTIRGSDGEAYRESTGTVPSPVNDIVDPVTAAEEIAFCRACARFGLGLYLYHDE